MRIHDEFTVALVGRRLPDNENLGLGYLMAALRRAGVDATRHVLNQAADLVDVSSRIMSRPPGLVGLSIADGGSALYPLALGKMLRRQGYTGHITCGGQFATLARQWLLGRYGWLDSVVRHAGEVPLVDLVRRLEQGQAWQDVPGVTTRLGDGTPAPVLDAAPTSLWPEHDDLPRILGHRMAHLSTSRGCRGRCGFCGPAALLDLEVQEGLRAGIPRSVLASGGAGGTKRRSVASICDEMAHLWHERGVRYFYLVDEHPLPWKEEQALDFIARWKQGLEERAVGRLGIGAMLRSDRITPPIVRALADLGLVRAFVGVELATPREARLFGRASMATRVLGIIATFEELGTATITNVMLVHPYSTSGSIEEGIGYLEALPAGAFEVTQMQVYHGTTLHRLVEAEGRLEGNPLRYGYGLTDPVAGRFAEIFTRLRIEAFRDYSLAYVAFDMRYAVALERRLRPGRQLDGLWRRASTLASRANRIRCQALRRALELAARGIGYEGCSSLVREASLQAAPLRDEIDRVSSELESSPGGPRRVFRPMRAAAAAALQFCLLGAPQAGCGSAETLVGSDAGHEVSDPEDDGACTRDDYTAIYRDMERIAREVDPCFVGTAHWFESTGSWTVEMTGGLGYSMCSNWEEQAAREDALEVALEAVDIYCDPTSGEFFGYLDGLENDEVEDAFNTIWESRCRFHVIAIVVDEDGRVVDVQTREGDPVDSEIRECILAALDGLVFPCLAGYTVCEEPVVLE